MLEKFKSFGLSSEIQKFSYDGWHNGEAKITLIASDREIELDAYSLGWGNSERS